MPGFHRMDHTRGLQEVCLVEIIYITLFSGVGINTSGIQHSDVILSFGLQFLMRRLVVLFLFNCWRTFEEQKISTSLYHQHHQHESHSSSEKKLTGRQHRIISSLMSLTCDEIIIQWLKCQNTKNAVGVSS